MLSGDGLEEGAKGRTCGVSDVKDVRSRYPSEASTEYRSESVCMCVSPLLSSEGNPAGDGVMCHDLPVCFDSLRDIDLTGQAISRPGY